MMVRISGGAHSYLEGLFMIFTDKDWNYPMRGVTDNIPGVCYRIGPEG